MSKNLGKTVRIFMADGTPSGLLTAEIINWTGRFYLVPRPKIPDLAKREDVKRTGLYVLSGSSENNLSREKVYIGESDNVLKRLVQHEKNENKDFWNRAVMVVSKDENLTKSHVRYLESRLIEIAKKSQRAEIDNTTAPDTKSIPESEAADMEFFLDQILLILPILGFTFTKPSPTSSDNIKEPKNSSPLFSYEFVGTHATAREIEGEFIVFKGSTARKESKPSWKSYKGLREQLLKDGKIIDSPDKEFYIFKENVAFNSPSAAAAVIFGGNQNGRKRWRIQGSKKTYAQWKEELLKDIA